MISCMNQTRENVNKNERRSNSNSNYRTGGDRNRKMLICIDIIVETWIQIWNVEWLFSIISNWGWSYFLWIDIYPEYNLLKFYFNLSQIHKNQLNIRRWNRNVRILLEFTGILANHFQGWQISWISQESPGFEIFLLTENLLIFDIFYLFEFFFLIIYQCHFYQQYDGILWESLRKYTYFHFFSLSPD